MGSARETRNRYGASAAGAVTVTSEGYRIVHSYRVPLPSPAFSGDPASPYGVAVDIGTTTIALELVDRVTGAVLASVSLLNSQRRWGSDVISRIRAANSGQGAAMQRAVHQNVLDGILRLVQTAGVAGSRIGCVAVAANTVMAHLFLGLSCAGMGQSPFTPEATEFEEILFTTFFHESFSTSSVCRLYRTGFTGIERLRRGRCRGRRLFPFGRFTGSPPFYRSWYQRRNGSNREWTTLLCVGRRRTRV